MKTEEIMKTEEMKDEMMLTFTNETIKDEANVLIDGVEMDMLKLRKILSVSEGKNVKYWLDLYAEKLKDHAKSFGERYEKEVKMNTANKSKESKTPSDVCEGCSKERGEPLHTCPFAEDIHQDSNTLCNCCEDCQHGCCMDI